jgi:hypothetical protein
MGYEQTSAASELFHELAVLVAVSGGSVPWAGGYFPDADNVSY